MSVAISSKGIKAFFDRKIYQKLNDQFGSLVCFFRKVETTIKLKTITFYQIPTRFIYRNGHLKNAHLYKNVSF